MRYLLRRQAGRGRTAATARPRYQNHLGITRFERHGLDVGRQGQWTFQKEAYHHAHVTPTKRKVWNAEVKADFTKQHFNGLPLKILLLSNGGSVFVDTRSLMGFVGDMACCVFSNHANCLPITIVNLHYSSVTGLPRFVFCTWKGWISW